MNRVLVLGGCGAVGSVAAEKLAGQAVVDELIVGDLRGAAAQALAQRLGPKVRGLAVDALDESALARAMAGCQVVLNCTGPFYRFVKPVLRTALALKIPYVDVCDDVDVTEEILGWNEQAQAAGVCALIGMGNSPGVTNLLALLAARDFLDRTESIDIYHAHGGEPVEGEGVIGHRFHCMSIPVPMYLDGELKTVDFFGPDGEALQEDVDFYRIGKGIRVYPYPHPEQLTLPRAIPCQRVTNKGTVLPAAYYELTRDLCRLGLASREPVGVQGAPVIPYDFAVAYILRERERILRETEFGTQRGANKIVVQGVKDDKPCGFIFHLASESQALGEGTGIPAAMGTLLMLAGKIEKTGVLPPEACVEPADFLALVSEMMPPDKSGRGFDGVRVERIDEHGQIHKLDF